MNAGAAHRPRSHPPAPFTLVTGGAGFIGSHLVERLLAEGRRVVVIDDFSTGQRANLLPVATHPALRILAENAATCTELPRLAADADFIFHLAAAVGVDLVLEHPTASFLTNLRTTEAVLAAAAAARTPVLYTSSSEVYGKSSRPILSEEDDLMIGPPTVSRWGYACSKLMDEFIGLASVKEHGLPLTIARLFNTIGPRQSGRYGMVLPRFIAAARAGAPLRVFGDGHQTRCFCSVHDTVEALLRLERTPQARGEIVNVGSTQEISIRALAAEVIAVLASSSTIEYVPYEQAYGPGFQDLSRRRPDTSKLERLTSFQPCRTLTETIALIARTHQF